MPESRVETQKQRAEWVIGEMRHHVGPLLKRNENLKEVLGRAQNDPPQGASDRTINPAEFTKLREVENAVARLRRALENVWKPTENEPSDPNDWQAP